MPEKPIQRQRLPHRRASETFDFELDGLHYRTTASRYEDGRVGEIFLASHKAGSHADTAARDSAIAVSLALQHGADVETIRRGLSRDARGHASGPLGRALDLIAEHEAAAASQARGGQTQLSNGIGNNERP
jgi:ribonucleoside-diphosphate reductase alpha chain